LQTLTAIIEHCPETNLYVGHVPGVSGTHSQGATVDELKHNLEEVIAMLAEDGKLHAESGFVGTCLVKVS
jgi:predicted RNase H-like HicB family nuclease